MVDTPRKRIVVPEPKFPDEAIMSNPAIRPCKASSAEVKDKLVYVGNSSKTGAYMALLSGQVKREMEELEK